MVLLERIKKNEKTIEADFYPETSENFGHIEIDIESGEIKKQTHVEGFDNGYASHACRELKRIMKENVIPEKRLVMWY